MATLHRIVLAIASSLNNGTSSPAPQGNRALRNKTNALAERQEPTSAKTPPIFNRIGKGIGKFWIPILLVTATALTQAPIEQAGAWAYYNSEEGILIIGPTPPAPVSIPLTYGSTNSATSTPAAVPPPLLAAPAAPVIKKAVLHVGTYLVCAVGEWFIGKQMDKLTKAEVDKAAGQTATCGVESILWEGNSTKVTTRAIAGFSNMWGLRAGQSATLSVRQGQEDTPASGTQQSPTIGSVTLTSAQAKSHLHHARGTLVMSTYEIINSRGRIDTIMGIQARKDKIADQNNKLIQRVRRRTGDPSWRFHKHIDERKVEYNVDSYRVTSDFNDPIPTYSKLREPGEDERAHSYEATVTWKMRPLREDGRWGPSRDMEHTFPKGDAEGNGDLRLPSYEDSSFPFDFCDSNQRISNIQCRAFINRRVMDRDITEIRQVRKVVRVRRRELVDIPIYGWRLEEKKIGTERIVVHDSN